MQQKLIMYLQTDESKSPDWIVMEGESVIQLSTSDHHENKLSDLAINRQVIVLVPAEEVLLTSVRLPKVNRSRLAHILPFALEEQVIDEIETLHFAAGDYQADGSLSVAIVSRKKMQAWLNQLQTLQIQADILMPLSMTLPTEEKSWVIALHEMAIVRMNGYQGFACDSNNLHALLELALQTANPAPVSILIHHYSQDKEAYTLQTSIPVKEVFHEQALFINDCMSHALQTPFLNLLQGMYKPRKTRRFPEMHKLWKTVNALGTAWLALLMLYPALSYFMLKHRETNINNEMAAIYHRYFPAASSVVAPKLRLQEKLYAYTSQTDGNKLFMLMGLLGESMRKTSGITLKRLDFQGKQLSLELTAASSSDFSSFTDVLVHRGLTIRQDSANVVGSTVNAVIKME